MPFDGLDFELPVVSRAITFAVVHCAATTPGWYEGKSSAEKVAEIKRWHTDPKPQGRGWRNIGYHFIIDRDGTIVAGAPLGNARPMEQIGAHVRGKNRGSVGICLLGGHGSATTDEWQDHFNPSQINSLKALLFALERLYPGLDVFGHNTFAAKACPGFDMEDLWADWKGSTVEQRQYVRPLLKYGHTGAEVVELQSRLAALGYALGEPDGHFGNLTRSAVMAFQAESKLKSDGIVGPTTWGAMEEAKPRSLGAREGTTVADLRAKGSTTIKKGDTLEIMTATAGVGGVLGQFTGAFDQLGSVAAELELAKDTAEGLLSSPVTIWLLGNLPLLGFLILVGILIYGIRAWKENRAAEAREGRNLGR
jgi:N-acetylmuramoyl-L-alanine amidase